MIRYAWDCLWFTYTHIATWAEWLAFNVGNWEC